MLPPYITRQESQDCKKSNKLGHLFHRNCTLTVIKIDVLGSGKVLSTIIMVKDQIQCRSQSLFNFRRICYRVNGTIVSSPDELDPDWGNREEMIGILRSNIIYPCSQKALKRYSGLDIRSTIWNNLSWRHN